MKVIRLPKFIKAVPGILISGLLFFALMFAATPDARGATPADTSVCVPGVVCATVTLPAVTLPGTTVTLPRATVTVPTTVRVPGPVSTVTVPGGTKTVTQRIPGPVSTVTIVRDAAGKTTTIAPTGQTGQPSARVSTVTATTTVTATRTDVRTVPRDRVVNLTKPGAVGYSLGLVALGIFIALLALFIAYQMGYFRAEDQNVEELQSLRDSLHDER